MNAQNAVLTAPTPPFDTNFELPVPLPWGSRVCKPKRSTEHIRSSNDSRTVDISTAPSGDRPNPFQQRQALMQFSTNGVRGRSPKCSFSSSKTAGAARDQPGDARSAEDDVEQVRPCGQFHTRD